METIPVRDDSRHLLGVGWIDEIDLGELTQSRKVLEEVLVTESLDIGEIMVHVAEELCT